MAAEGTLTRAVAVVSGLGGAATLVTITGGAIVWIRFDQAELPADQAVAVTPKNELVAVGATALVGFLLIGLLAVLVAWLLDPYGRSGDRNVLGMCALGLAAVVTTIAVSRPLDTRAILATALAVLGGALFCLVARRAVKKQGTVNERGMFALPLWLVPALGLLLAPLAVALAALTGEWWVGVMTGVAAALGGIGLAIAQATGSDFRWFGVTVFLGAIVFGGTLSALRTASEAKLQAVAVTRTGANGGALTGLWIAETSERVYVADVRHCRRDADLRLVPRSSPVRDSGRIIGVPRASVDTISIGKRERLANARLRGAQLLAEVRQRTRAEAPAPTDAAADPCADEGVLDLSARPPATVTPATAARLARRFRPVLLFDGFERWRPLNIGSLLTERTAGGAPRHRICSVPEGGGKELCDPIYALSDVSDATPAGSRIDFQGRLLGGREHRAPDLGRCPGPQAARLLDCDRGPASAIYYRVSRANGRYYVDYWWYLRYNNFPGAERLCSSAPGRAIVGCFDHEGDWEGVTVVAGRRATDLAGVGLAAHAGVFRYGRSELELDGTRPLIYSARGSHASYPHRCAGGCRQPSSKLPEARTDGKVPWGRNADADCFAGTSCLRPLPARAFNAFAGRWGSRVCRAAGRRCALANGPQSPARQRRYQRPWCFTGPRGRLACDGTPPRR